MIRSIAERKAELAEELARLEAEEKALTERRHVVIGRIVEGLMAEDEALKARVEAALEKQVRKAAEREAIGLAKLPTARGRPRKAG